MKKSLLLVFLLPLLALGQSEDVTVVFESGLLTPNPTQVVQLEKGLTAHNKKYHGEGPYGTRVYWVSNGPNTGSYVWVMGGLPWGAMDNRPGKESGHDADWDNNVAPYLTAGSGAQTYWKFNPKLSRFGKDFNIKYLLVDYYDIKRGKKKDALKLVEKIHKAYAEKLPEEIFGIYTNEFPSTEDGRDLAVISFFDKSSWLGEEGSVAKKYDEMYGAGSFEKFIADWMEVTEGGATELWVFRPDLSGKNGEVKAMP